jgi:hypothetical protein
VADRSRPSGALVGYYRVLEDIGNVADMLEVYRMVLETGQSRCHGTMDARCEIIGRVVIEGCRAGQRLAHRRPDRDLY